jgi:hypothetical protein
LPHQQTPIFSLGGFSLNGNRNDDGTKLAFKNSFAPRLFLVKKMDEISRKEGFLFVNFYANAASALESYEPNKACCHCCKSTVEVFWDNC